MAEFNEAAYKQYLENFRNIRAENAEKGSDTSIEATHKIIEEQKQAKQRQLEQQQQQQKFEETFKNPQASYDKLINETSLFLAGGDQAAAKRIADTIRRGKIDEIEPLAKTFGLTLYDLTGLNINKPLSAEAQYKVKTARQDFNTLVQEEAFKQAQNPMQKQLDALYGQFEQSGIQKLEERFGEQRKRVLNEQAVLGRLDSPVSGYNIGAVDTARERSIVDYLGNLAGSRIGNQLDITKLLQSLGSEERLAERGFGLQGKQLEQQQNQYLKNYDLAKEQQRIDQSLGEQGIKVAGQPRDKQGRDWLDYLNTGLTGLPIVGGGFKAYQDYRNEKKVKK